MCQLWICFCCRFHASSITQQLFTIPCVRYDSNFAIESMRRPWLYFCYRFHAWAVNYLTLSIPYVSYDSDFSDDFKVCMDSVFADDLWITSDIAFLTIPCVSHDSIFAIDLMRRSWIHWRCRFHSAYGSCHSVFCDDFKVYRDSIFADNLWISSDTAFLTIPCVSHDSIFAIDLMCRSWIHWRCRFHTAAVTQYSLTIPRSTGTLFSLTISSQ
jgi:hypothetical protein